MKRLSGKIAIVTGGASGMGNGAARVMAGYGAKVVIVDNSENVFSVAKDMQQEGYEVTGYQADVRDSGYLKELYAKIAGQFGKIDILVNAAGIGVMRYFVDASDEFRDSVLDINLKGIWNSCKAAVPHMVKAKYGKIVNFSSVTGCMVVDPGMTAYAMTKGGVLAFTKALAAELAQLNITVNAILPGMVDTPMLDKSCIEACPEDPQSVKDAIAVNIPMRRLGTSEEAGKVVAFLASDDSSYVTGTHIVFDGGSTLPETPGTGWAPGEC